MLIRSKGQAAVLPCAFEDLALQVQEKTRKVSLVTGSSIDEADSTHFFHIFSLKPRRETKELANEIKGRKLNMKLALNDAVLGLSHKLCELLNYFFKTKTSKQL